MSHSQPSKEMYLSQDHSTRRTKTICFVATNRGLVSQLLAGASRYLGGVELQVSLLASQLAQRRWRVTLVVADEGQETMVEASGLRLITSFPYSGKGPWSFLHRGEQLARALEVAQADVYTLQGASWQTSLISGYCRRSGARFVFWIASNTDPMCRVWGKSRTRWWERRMAWRGMRGADAIIAQTQYQVELVKEYLGRDAFVVRNIWPYETCVREVPSAPTVLWVANLRKVKRPEMVLEIAKRLPEIQFVMVGGPVAKHERYYDEIMQRAAGIPNLTCTGFLPFPEADKLFEQATVFLNTSSVEGFPNTYLQAWARGVPVVGSFDPDEVICRKGLGVHFETVDEAVEAIARLCSCSQQEMRAIGERAVQYVRENHSPEVVLDQFERVLQTLEENDR